MTLHGNVPRRGAVALSFFHKRFGVVSSFQSQNVVARVKEFGKAVEFAVVRADFGLKSAVDGTDDVFRLEGALEGGLSGVRRGGGGGGRLRVQRRHESIDAG